MSVMVGAFDPLKTTKTKKELYESSSKLLYLHQDIGVEAQELEQVEVL